MKENTVVVEGLNGLLADATVFYQKLRHYHWNVEGSHFFELHTKFEELYDRWSDVIDELAERILMIGGVPLHTLSSMLEAASLREDETTPAAGMMVEAVVADAQSLHGRARRVIANADATDDRGTVNLLDGVCDAIEKDLWMLRAWKKEAEGAWK
jgi:starvation-inducible DNA-binding protein